MIVQEQTTNHNYNFSQSGNFISKTTTTNFGSNGQNLESVTGQTCQNSYNQPFSTQTKQGNNNQNCQNSVKSCQNEVELGVKKKKRLLTKTFLSSFVLASIILLSLCGLFWYFDVLKFNLPQKPEKELLTMDINQTSIAQIITSASSPQIESATTQIPGKVIPKSSTLVEINKLQDLIFVSNQTKEILIKSTHFDGALNDDFDFNDYPSPSGRICVIVADSGEKLEYLKEILEWLSSSIFELKIDATFLKEECKDNKNKGSKFLPGETLNFRNLQEIIIYNLSRCMISKYVRNFRVPQLKIVEVASVGTGEEEYGYFHRDLVQIFNLSTLDYELVFLE